ncbi:MAG: hypothetical protein RSJ40_09625 [Acetivibrio sp.]
MGIYRKLGQATKKQLILKFGQHFDMTLDINRNLPFDLLFDFALGSAYDC